MKTPESNVHKFKDIPPGTRVPLDLCADLLDAAKPHHADSPMTPSPRKPEKKEKGKVTPEEAERVMGKQDFIGPDALKAIYGGVELKEIPPILFSAQELQEAKERGEFLILRLNTLPDGKPATMKNLHEYFSDFKLLASPSDDWKLKSDFFTKETPSVSWALVSKEFVPSSTSKNYYEQTSALCDHLKNEVYKEGMPRKYEEAIEKFEAWASATFPGKTPAQIKAELQDNNKWKKYAESLAQLDINQLCRQSGATALFDLATYYKHASERLLPRPVTWTNSRDSDGDLVDVGRFGAGGAGVGGCYPGSADADLGVLLSRTA